MHDTELPYLLLDERKCKANIRRMADRMSSAGIRFRPHMKTHQSAAIAGWCRPYTNSITVASPGEVAYFRSHGWDEILMAFPLSNNELKFLVAHDLAGRGLDVLVDGPVDEQLAIGLGSTGIYIDIDCGYGRTGIPWNDSEMITATRDSIVTRGLWLKGVYAHFGDHYQAGDMNGVAETLDLNLQRLGQARDQIRMDGMEMCSGDTPSGNLLDRQSGLISYHGGNFIFYDMQQVALGSCGTGDVALSLVAEVVSIYPHRSECLVRAGAVHLSKDSYRTGTAKDTAAYGEVFALADGLPDISERTGTLRMLSQEHGIVRITGSSPLPGQRLAILPAHSCLSASMFPAYHTHGGDVLTRRAAITGS